MTSGGDVAVWHSIISTGQRPRDFAYISSVYVSKDIVGQRLGQNPGNISPPRVGRSIYNSSVPLAISSSYFANHEFHLEGCLHVPRHWIRRPSPMVPWPSHCVSIKQVSPSFFFPFNGFRSCIVSKKPVRSLHFVGLLGSGSLSLPQSAIYLVRTYSCFQASA